MAKKELIRAHNRALDSLRSIRVSYDVYGYGSASVLFELGGTKILCSINLQQGVPSFLKGKKTGWLTAEYAMLPAATHVRKQRESSSIKRNGRSVEISRLIGRSLRAMVNLNALGERTIYIDCDVLQADGGTRTACITAAGLALEVAVDRWLSRGLIKESIIIERVAAVSVGVCNGVALLDLDFAEDSTIDADFNVVATVSGKLIEMQGTAEKQPLSWDEFEKLRVCAQAGIQQLVTVCNAQRLAPEFDGSVGGYKPFSNLKKRENTAS